MHELSVITAVADTVEEYLKARADEATGNAPKAGDPRVTRITLQIGKKSTYMPDYIREIWPVAVKETPLDGATLELEDIEGRDFLIKEIEIEE